MSMEGVVNYGQISRNDFGIKWFESNSGNPQEIMKVIPEQIKIGVKIIFSERIKVDLPHNYRDSGLPRVTSCKTNFAGNSSRLSRVSEYKILLF